MGNTVKNPAFENKDLSNIGRQNTILITPLAEDPFTRVKTSLPQTISANRNEEKKGSISCELPNRTSTREVNSQLLTRC